MKIKIGADHAGVALKAHLAERLVEKGHEIEDLGPFSKASVDYPDYAAAVAKAVVGDPGSLGLLICGTGIGVAISANKVHGVRAASCNDLFTARLAREHNDANVLTLGARVIGQGLAEAIVDTFLGTPFAAGRHRQRVEKIAALERG
jgi:ribose 5-phosphate isomerase B